MLRKQLQRAQVLELFGQPAAYLVAMEACASSHFWGRAIERLGLEVWLIPPA